MESRQDSRLIAARGRARAAKVALGVAGAVGFVAWMGLARATFKGHEKHQVQPLTIPKPMYDVVRQNLLQAGIVAPTTAPADATTSTS